MISAAVGVALRCPASPAASASWPPAQAVMYVSPKSALFGMEGWYLSKAANMSLVAASWTNQGRSSWTSMFFVHGRNGQPRARNRTAGTELNRVVALLGAVLATLVTISEASPTVTAWAPACLAARHCAV